jgi:acetyltransferase-like isoleucine patch superfamily enzyme/CelD/BcsL family acetyltransferase involved in cellulose biosynthesis
MKPSTPLNTSSTKSGNELVVDSGEPSRVFVHPYGLCESEHVGTGTRIWAFAHVLAGAKVGRDCNICDHAYVEGGVTIGNRVTVKNGVMLFDRVTIEDDVFLGPAVVFTNDMRPRAAIKRRSDELLPTLVQVGATLGACAVVVCGVTIGAHAFIGAGAAVTRDVPAYGLVVGNPGRLIGWACECGTRLADDLSCMCGRSYKQESTGLIRTDGARGIARARRPERMAALGTRSVVADPRTDSRWLVLASSAEGSLFTSPPWIRAVCETYNFTPQARIVTDAEGRPTDGFTWVPISDILGDRLVSLPFSDRAEPFVGDPANWSPLLGDLLLTGVPLTIRCQDGAVPTADDRLMRAGEAAWHVTPLDRPLQELHRSISSAARRNIAAADRNDVHVEAATGLDALRTFHRLHVSLRKYKYRLLAQPFSLFERIWQEFTACDGIVTFLARVDGEPIAGAVHLVWNDVLYYKFGASLTGALPLRPNDALAWTALRWASERGLRLYDWGLSDLNQPGLIAYKRKWASEERRIVTLCSPSRGPNNHRDPDQVLGDLTCLLTDDAVPDQITERAGSLLYRYFA